MRATSCINFLVTAFAASTLAACSGPLSGSTTGGGLFGSSAKASSTAIIAVDRAGEPCKTSTVTIGRSAGAHFEEVATVGMGDKLFGRSHYATLQLAPGVYHVIAATCSDGRRNIALGRSAAGNALGIGQKQYRKSFGRFQLDRAGEIVNAGTLQFQITNGVSTYAIIGLPPEVLRQITASEPELAGRMITRLMLNADGALSARPARQ